MQQTQVKCNQLPLIHGAKHLMLRKKNYNALFSTNLDLLTIAWWAVQHFCFSISQVGRQMVESCRSVFDRMHDFINHWTNSCRNMFVSFFVFYSAQYRWFTQASAKICSTGESKKFDCILTGVAELNQHWNHQSASFSSSQRVNQQITDIFACIYACMPDVAVDILPVSAALIWMNVVRFGMCLKRRSYWLESNLQ